MLPPLLGTILKRHVRADKSRRLTALSKLVAIGNPSWQLDCRAIGSAKEVFESGIGDGLTTQYMLLGQGYSFLSTR
jgi:hypothetical protein